MASGPRTQQGLAAYVVVDRDTAARFGITAATIDNALYDAFGQRIVSTIFTESNQYRVIMEASPSLQRSPTSLDQIYVPSAGGGQVPPLGHRADRGARGAPPHQPPEPVPRQHDLLQRPEGRIPRRVRRGGPRGGGRAGDAGQRHHELPGRGLVLRGVAHEPALPHPCWPS